jgi:hypothetical protein
MFYRLYGLSYRPYLPSPYATGRYYALTLITISSRRLPYLKYFISLTRDRVLHVQLTPRKIYFPLTLTTSSTLVCTFQRSVSNQSHASFPPHCRLSRRYFGDQRRYEKTLRKENHFWFRVGSGDRADAEQRNLSNIRSALWPSLSTLFLPGRSNAQYYQQNLAVSLTHNCSLCMMDHARL